jgi:lipopolysaccharide export system protein LptA
MRQTGQKYIFLRLIRAALLCVLPAILPAQQSKVIELRSADKLEGKVINGEEVRELLGHVYFVQPAEGGGLVHVWCDRALKYVTQNKMELFGHVKVLRDSTTLFSDEGMYYGNSKTIESSSGVRLQRGKTILTSRIGKYDVDAKHAEFTENVVLIDSTSIITCHKLHYYEGARLSIALDSGHVTDRTSGMQIFGDSLVHFEKTQFTAAAKHPRIVQFDTSESGKIDTTIISAVLMHSYKDSLERVCAYGNVQMIRTELACRCEEAVFFVKKDSIILRRHPVLWNGGNQITGDSIFIRLQKRRLERLSVLGHAMGLFPADSLRPARFHQLTGRRLIMSFTANKLHQVDVLQNATSFYYVYDKKDPSGANKSSGDKIHIYFIKGEVDRIKVVHGVEGQYFPEKMLNNREAEYNLDGFRVMENKPKRDGIIIVSQ